MVGCSDDKKSELGAPPPQGTGGTGGAGGGEGGINLGAGATGQGGDSICETSDYEPEDIKLDMLVILDRSGSMGQKWDQSVTALTTFYNDTASAGIGVSMNFFPYEPVEDTDACNPNSFNPPHIPIGDLPDHAALLITGMNTENATGPNTPMYGALFGSYQWATEYQDDNPERKVIVVFASDGEPNTCPGNQNDSTVLAGLAQSAYNYNSVQTYVIAIQGSDLVTLNLIASAGGTGMAFDITTDTTQFAAKMEEIRQQALGCEYVIPEQEIGSDEFDETKVNVDYIPGTGSTQELPQADDASDCGAGPGWYYDDPEAPTKIILCPASCNQVQIDPDPKISLKFGCPSKMN